jgi:hypothetical protein
MSGMPVLCAVEDCNRPVHGRSAYCAGHERRRERGRPLCVPLRTREREPDRAVVLALERWLEALHTRQSRLSEMLATGQIGCGDLRSLFAAIKRRADVEADDELGWRRAQTALRKTLERYVDRCLERRRVTKSDKRATVRSCHSRHDSGSSSRSTSRI